MSNSFDIASVPGCPADSGYLPVSLKEAYSLLNTGGIVLVCTRETDGRYDLAPVAWACPLDYEPASRVLVVMDPGHQTVRNIQAKGSFVLALPTWKQKELVQSTGAVSGKNTDKYAELGIAAFAAAGEDALVPEGVAGWLECRLIEVHSIGSVVLLAAEAERAYAVDEAWTLRLHMASEGLFYRPGAMIV